MLDRLTLFDLVGRKLDYTAERHATITRNLANADTPGFVAQDLVEPDFERELRGALTRTPLQLARTDRHHHDAVASLATARLVDTPAELSPSGNAVSLELEAGKLRSNSSQHRLGTLIYGKYMGLLKAALGQGG